MSIIPRAEDNESRRMNVSSPVPIASSGDARIPGEALADFGKGVTDVGLVLTDYFHKQDVIARQQRIQLTNDDQTRVHKIAYQEAIRDSKESNGSDIWDLYNSKLTKPIGQLFSTIQDDSEVVKAADDWDKHLRNNFQSEYTGDTIKMATEANTRGFTEIVQRKADAVRETPDTAPAELADIKHNIDMTVLKGGFNQAEADERYEQIARPVIADQYIQGLYDTGKNGKALRALESTKEKNKVSPELLHVMDGMTAPKKADWIERLKAKQSTDDESRLSELHLRMKAIENEAKTGSLKQGDIQHAVALVNSSSKLAAQPELKKEMLVRLMLATRLNTTLQALVVAKPNERAEIMARSDAMTKGIRGAIVKMDPEAGDDVVVRNALTEGSRIQAEALAAVLKDQREQPAAYIMKYFTDVRDSYRATAVTDPVQKVQATTEYRETMRAKQNALGMQVQFLPNANAEADLFKAQPSAMDKAQYLNEMQAQWGSDTTNVMDQIFKADKDVAKYRGVVYLPPELRAEAVKNIDGIPGWKDKAEEGSSKNIYKIATEKMNEFYLAFANGANTDERAGITEDMRLVMVGAGLNADSRGENYGDAIDSAFDRFIGSQFSVADGGVSSAVVPKQFNAAAVDRFLQANYYADDLKKWNLPKSNVTVKSENLKWVTNDAMDGLQLKRLDPKNRLYMPVNDTSGKKVEVRYSDIESNPEWQRSVHVKAINEQGPGPGEF